MMEERVMTNKDVAWCRILSITNLRFAGAPYRCLAESYPPIIY